MKSIQMRNFFTVAVILLLCFAVLGVSFALVSYEYVRRDRTEALVATGEYVTGSVAAFARMWDLSSLEMRMLLASVSSISGVDLLLCDTEGMVISCSDRELVCPHLGETVRPALLESAEEQGSYSFTGSLDGLYDSPRMVYILPVRSEITGKPLCYAVLSAENSFFLDTWRAFALRFAILAAIVLTLAFVVTLLTAKKQTKPINDMAAAAQRFARGDFSARVTVDPGRRDEIADLAGSFNAMADSLERSERLRREFVANVSHELKTPLTTITGFSDGILDGTIPPEAQARYLNVISSEARRMNRLVRSMLEMSQLQNADPTALLQKSFDISQVVGETLLSLEEKINSRQLDVDPHIPDQAMLVRGDRDAITQVLYNLLDNAVKFAEPGTTLGLDLWRQGGKAFVSVENTGQTIPQEELPLIFDRFHKTDKSRSLDRDGVGLGLYIVKTILDRHNENIYVTSSEGVTRFVFSLTLAE